MKFLILQTKECYLLYKEGHLRSNFDKQCTYLDKPIGCGLTLTFKEALNKFTTVDISELNSNFIEVIDAKDNIYIPEVDYCWQAGNYLVTLTESRGHPTVTILAYIKVNGVWLANCINNANFLYDTWFSFWKSEILATCWYTYQSVEIGSCDWNLTDTPITVANLAKALYEYPDWVKGLDEDRKAGEWEEVNDS